MSGNIYRLKVVAAAIVAAGLAGGASPPPSEPFTVCQLMDASERFDGQMVKAEGYLSRDSHGVHLLEPGCAYEINLAWPDDLSRAGAFRRAVEQLRRQPMMVRLRVSGRFKDPKPVPADKPEEGPAGRLEDVLEFLIGPYLDLTEAKVLSATPLSERDAARYQDWLDDPSQGPFRPGP